MREAPRQTVDFDTQNDVLDTHRLRTQTVCGSGHDASLVNEPGWANQLGFMDQRLLMIFEGSR